MSSEEGLTPKELAELQNEFEREDREEDGRCDVCKEDHCPNLPCGIPDRYLKMI
jgi:hypothetical protein